MSTITLLGTGTCQIEPERRASSVLVELESLRVLFDCGHGVVQRLLEAGIQHHEIEHIVLSHFHPDHVSDIVPFLQAGAWSKRNPRTTNVHIYGPEGVREIIHGLVQVFGEKAIRQPSYEIIVHEITEERFTIDGHTFDFVSLPPAGNHGLRFEWHGKQYAVTGDSYFHENEIRFLHEVDMGIIDSGHIEDEEIVQLAVASQAKVIVCSHLYREIDAGHLQVEAESREYKGTIIVGRDLMSFVL